jgi:hypothetical protein
VITPTFGKLTELWMFSVAVDNKEGRAKANPDLCIVAGD